jgi:hypothetical protein
MEEMKINVNIMAATLRDRPSTDTITAIKDELKLCIKYKQWTELQEDLAFKQSREDAERMKFDLQK